MKSKKRKNKKVLEFLEKNWSNVLSVLISMIAVAIAIQANAYNRNSSAAFVKIEDVSQVYGRKEMNQWPVKVSGCNAGVDKYVLEYEVVGEFWISNTGGLDVTLLSVDFSSDIEINRDPFLGDIPFWNVRMREHNNPYSPGSVIYLLGIPSGSSIPIYTYATARSYYKTLDDAANYFDSLLKSAFVDILNKPGTWVFRFSNGGIQIKTYENAKLTNIITIPDQFKQYFEQPEDPLSIMKVKLRLPCSTGN